jgi:anthranilate phosphoribosyltransferase
MLSEAIKKLVAKEDLSLEEARGAMNDVMSGNSTAAQIGGFLVGMRMKGETIDEITGCAIAMKEKAVAFDFESGEGIKSESSFAIDTCGTGGDGGRTFNISTAVALIAASGDIKVIKHGNRAVSSSSGSADVLAEMGFDVDMDPSKARECLENTGMTFLFAPRFHTAMKNAAPVRKELGMRTIFNILGPLTNPGRINGQVLGVFDGELTHTLAEVLMRLGRERAMVVHGIDGMDEITTTTFTKVSEIRGGNVVDYILNPEDYGIKLCRPEDITGGGAKENAEIIMNILKGEKGPKRDIVVLNSAAALYVGKTVESLQEGVDRVNYLLDKGIAYEKTNEIINYVRRC